MYVCLWLCLEWASTFKRDPCREQRAYTHICIHLEKAARTKANGSKTKRMETTMEDHKDIYILCAGLRSYAIDEIRITEEGKEKFN